MSKYRKKPVVIEAFKWTGGVDQTEDPDWAIDAIKNGIIIFKSQGTKDCCLLISTLEGDMTASKGDWIIKGVQGEFYPCKPDIFEATYDDFICEGMDFGKAVRALKDGQKVARNGWNGKGMWLVLIPAGNAMYARFDMQDCIGMKTANNVMQPGWLASQTDMLAEDWVLVK